MDWEDDDRELFRELFNDIRRVGGFGITVVRHPNQAITDLRPHYTNQRFKKPQTVYLAGGSELIEGDYSDYVEGAEYAYSDRIRGWFKSEDLDRAWNAAKDSGHNDRCAAFYEVYLRTLYNDPALELVHIIARVNVSNGYDYQVYGWIPGKTQNEEQQP